jgi:hypothetical protein
MGSGSLNAYTAVIDATAGCLPGAQGLPPALVPIAGVPLLTRNLEACQAAGLRKVLVTVDGTSLDDVRRLGRRFAPRLLVEVVPAARPDPWLAVRAGLNRAALVLPGDRLVQAALLLRLQAGPIPEAGAVLAIDRGDPDDRAGGGEGQGVLVRREHVVSVGLEPVASNGRLTGVWIASAGFLDEVAAARLEGREAPLAGVLQAAAAGERLGWVATGPEPAPLQVRSPERAHETEAVLLARLSGGRERCGPIEHVTRLLVRRVVLPLHLSRWFLAIASTGLFLAGVGAIVLAGLATDWTRWLVGPGALLVLAGVLTARAEGRLTALRGRPALGGAWSDALRTELLGLVFFASLGVHLSLAARLGDESGPGGGISRASNVYLVLTVLFAVLVAYARYVVYFDVVRRLGGVAARARFTWWFDDPANPRRSRLSGPWRVLGGATWGTLVSLGALGVLAGLLQVAFLLAVAGAAGLFALALLHQIQRGDL